MARMVLYPIILALLVGLVGQHASGQLQFEKTRPHTIDVIRSRGFIGEEYTLMSQGAKLKLYRIINPLADQRTLNKYPVLYGHGILYESINMVSRSDRSKPRKPVLGEPTINYGFLDGSDDNSLPFALSNNNFDVWMFDGRGTSDKNRNLSAEINPGVANKFWDFSLDDQAQIDLPRLIDFVLTATSSTKLVYVGYSESTFFMFALLSARPEWADKLVAFVALAPVAYVSHIRGLAVPLLGPMLSILPEPLTHQNVLPQPVLDTVDTSMRTLCTVKGFSDLICGKIADGIGGKGASEHLPSFYSDFFHSTSFRSFRQFFQMYFNKRMAMYDFGPAVNMKVYGQPNSPDYNLGRIKLAGIILARGLSDFLSTPEDQNRLIFELGTKPYLDITLPHYNHFDFIDGKELIKLVNGPVITALFQLMYKQGPSILKNDQPLAQSAPAANNGFAVGGSPFSMLSATSSAATNRMQQMLFPGSSAVGR